MQDYKEIKIIEKELKQLYKSGYSSSAKPYLYFEEIAFIQEDVSSTFVNIRWGTEPKNKKLRINYTLDNVYLQDKASITEQVYYLLGIIHQHERNNE